MITANIVLNIEYVYLREFLELMKKIYLTSH